MILSKQKCCHLLTCVSTESQKRTSVLQTKRDFLATRSMTRINVGLALSYVKLLLSSGKIEGMVYHQIVGIPMGTNCAPLIADLFLFCCERDCMSNRHKSIRYDLIDMLNDTSRYLDYIFTIDNPEFEKHIPDIYNGTSVEQSKYFRQRNFFPRFKYKSYWQCIHTSVYDKRDDFGFLVVNFPWVSDDVPGLPSYGVYISQLVSFAMCCNSVSDFNSKNLQLICTSKLLTQGYRYHKLRKSFKVLHDQVILWPVI